MHRHRVWNTSSPLLRTERNRILNIDGFYYFSILDTPINGLWSDYVLAEIVNKLKELNHDWKEHLDKYFSEENEDWDVTLMDGLEDEDDIYI